MKDPRNCLQVIKAGADKLFLKEWVEAQGTADKLLKLRDLHAHHEKKFADTDARGAAVLTRQLLRGLGLHDAAERVGDLALPPSISYVADLRNELLTVARRRDLIPYERVLARLKLPKDDFGFRQLYRQLNVLAAKQLLMDEPQLCALVVNDKGIPGDGFFWVVDVERDDSESAKRAAHKAEVKRVYDRWPPRTA
jgi:hypothetical protein